MRAELRRAEAGVTRGGFWQFAAVVAAGMLLAINLSMSVANDMDWCLASGIDSERVAATASRIHELVPDLSEQEAYRQALVFQAAAQVPPLPDCKPSLNSMLQGRPRELQETR
jgi:hypothetical protein